MQKNKRLFLTAAVSAALLFGMNGYANAYTYSGVTTTVDNVTQDGTDLVVTGKSNVISKNDINLKQSLRGYALSGNDTNVTIGHIETIDSTGPFYWLAGSNNTIDGATVTGENALANAAYINLNSINSNLLNAKANGIWGEYLKDYFYINDKNQLCITSDSYDYIDEIMTEKEWISETQAYDPEYNEDDANLTIDYLVYKGSKPTLIEDYVGSNIIVSDNSKLNSNANIIAQKNITVTGNSLLKANNSLTTSTISVADSDVTVGDNASIASGGLKTTGSSRVDVSNGTLTVENGAVNIAKGGILKAKVLKAAATGTETSVIGSSTNIQGTLTVAGQVKGVTAGTASTDAVNKGQLDSAVNTLTTKISQGGKTYTAGSDIDISSANAISVKKAGLIASGNTGLVTGGTVYSTTNALNTQITATSQAVESLSDKISTYGKTISSISTSVTNTLSSMKNTQANFVDTSLSNISSDGKDVIKQMVKDVLAANTTSTTSSTASAKTANLLRASFAAAPMRAPANFTAGDYVDISGNTISVKADGTVASGNTGLVTGGAVYDAVKDKADKSYVDEGLAKKADISYVDQGLSQKVNVSDFTPVKQQVETNTSDISALKTCKADADGSNINVGSFTAKLNTGKVEKGNSGLVSGGTIYNSLQTKADVGYVNAMGLALDSEIKGTAQGLHNEIQDMGNRLTKDINRVGAGSAALAALHPQDFNPDDKWDFAVGYGHYKNANASAVGAFYRPNAGTTVSLAATIGNGDPQVSASVSFKIGMGKNVEKVMVNKDDYDKLNRKVESQAVENQEMKEAMANQNKKIQELEEAVKKLSTK